MPKTTKPRPSPEQVIIKRIWRLTRGPVWVTYGWEQFRVDALPDDSRARRAVERRRLAGEMPTSSPKEAEDWLVRTFDEEKETPMFTAESNSLRGALVACIRGVEANLAADAT